MADQLRLNDDDQAHRRFHDHLDMCRQCREHPFALCATGDRLLLEAVGARSPAAVPEGA